ncbi:MAG: long-chain fatty acid--CoA ligase [Bacteroidota bacterium]|nr:long-chain fatty acid--CoA ligase [Bacteroidota bacterium]
MVRRTFDLLERYKAYFPDKPDALAGKQNGSWVTYSSREYIEKANQVSYGLMALGFKSGDKIATISNNRPEWNFVDMGMAQLGVIHVPVYPTISYDDFTYIFRHSEPAMLIVSDKQLNEKLKPITQKIPSIKDIYTFNQVNGAKNWMEILELGKENAERFIHELDEIKASIKPSDMVTLIYTSGTTGVPKGVMLSHQNLVSNFIATAQLHSIPPSGKALSFLPLCHVYERMVNYHFQYKGIGIYYAENMGTLLENMQEIHPSIFLTVPRLLERIYAGIIGKGKDLPLLKKMIFFWAVNLGLRYEHDHRNGLLYDLSLKIADKLIFSKWREVIGGNVTYIVCGGAALQERLERIFCAARITILQGYGLTETSPVIAVNDPSKNNFKIGTVGTVLEDVDLKISDDGEILCKGPNVMMGYYKDPVLTSEVIDKEGWFHTGDVGVFVDKIFLKITDRKKEIFKLSSGKYVAPQIIENKCKESFFIEQVMVIGENEKFASAIISPNFNFLHNWCSRHGVSFRDNFELITIPKVIARYQREISHINKTLGQTEQLKRFRLVAEEWSQNTGELSPTLKLKRKSICDKYREIIDDIYAVKNGD